MTSISAKGLFSIAVTMVLATVCFAGTVPARNGGGTTNSTKVRSQERGMTWSGRVDDRVLIRIRGRSATTRTVSGRRTTGISYNFSRSLPTNRAVRVNVDRRDGRGSVRVIQQPARFNRYTAIVEIRDNDGGADFYRFDLDWSGGNYNNNDYGSGNPNFSSGAEMTWQGRVDDRVRIRVRNRIATVQTLRGNRTTGISYNFRRALPSRNNYVTVNKREGRGSVRVVEQPRRSNGYSAVIEIRDSSGGSDFYAFELNWEGGNYNNDYGTGNPNFSSGAEMTWQGRVDDRVRIRVRNRIATIQTLRGNRTTGVSYNFRRALPSRNNYVTVNKREGRGSVRVVEQPRRSNGYSAVIEIRDSSGGSDFYAFELNWNANGTGVGGNNNYGNSNGSMTWRGSVDATARIRISGRSARTVRVNGQSVRGVSYNFNGNLPRRNVYVRVRKEDGRGSVRVIQQPSSRNGYTAVVEIRDDKSGRDNYRFELEW